MWTLLAFSENIDGAGVEENLKAALLEQHLTTSGDDITVPVNMPMLIGALALLEGTADDYAKIVAPSLRRINNLMLPISIENIVPTNGNLNYLRPTLPIQLDAGEDINAIHVSDPGVASEQAVLVWLADNRVDRTEGDYYSIKATTQAVTTISESWVFTNIALVDDLPNGQYRIVGARVEGANAVAFRFVSQETGARPGGLVLKDPENVEHPLQRNGGLGEWLTFTTSQLPGIELLCGETAGAGVYDLIIDVEKIG